MLRPDHVQVAHVSVSTRHETETRLVFYAKDVSIEDPAFENHFAFCVQIALVLGLTEVRLVDWTSRIVIRTDGGACRVGFSKLSCCEEGGEGLVYRRSGKPSAKSYVISRRLARVTDIQCKCERGIAVWEHERGDLYCNVGAELPLRGCLHDGQAFAGNIGLSLGMAEPVQSPESEERLANRGGRGDGSKPSSNLCRNWRKFQSLAYQEPNQGRDDQAAEPKELIHLAKLS